MSAFAVNRHVEFVGGGVDRSGRDPDRSRRNADVDVQHRDRLDRRIVERAFVDHRQRAAGSFFRRLEQQHRGAVKRLARLVQHPRRAEQHRRVRVVAARVHLPGDRRRARFAGIFRDRQCIHVGAQADDVSAMRAAHDAEHAGLRDPPVLDADRVELALDDRLRVELFEAELGMPMDLAPNLGCVLDGVGRQRRGHVGVVVLMSP